MNLILFLVLNSLTLPSMNASSTGVSSAHMVMIQSATSMIPRGIVVYASLSFLISIEGISTIISV